MILVVGSTGSLGGAIARDLLMRGEDVRVLVRPHSEHRVLEQAGAEIAFGDLKDPDSLPDVLRGVDRVVSTATASHRGGEDTIEAVDVLGTSNLIEAAADVDLRRFVYVSALGFTEDSPHPLARAKGMSERRLRESGIPYTILQSALFMEVWIGIALGAQLEHGPSVTVIGDGNTKHAFIATRNVAELAVAVLGHEEARDTAVPLSCGSSTFREIIALVQEEIGREIEIRTSPPAELPPGFPPIAAELWELLNQAGDVDLRTDDAARTYGIDLVPVEEYVRTTFRS